MPEIKMNTVLALTDNLRQEFKTRLKMFNKVLERNKSAFRGAKSTYTPIGDYLDKPEKRGVQLVGTTVTEIFDEFIKQSGQFVETLFMQERTNASGLAKSHLVVDGEDWGEFTSSELLRLKNILDGSEYAALDQMINNIPTRSETENWKKCEDPQYIGRDVYETEQMQGSERTTVKESYILPDPNIASRPELLSNYTATVGVKENTIDIGRITHQRYSGELSEREASLIKQRKNILLNAVIKALKEANDCGVEKSTMTSEKLFGYLFYGQKKD